MKTRDLLYPLRILKQVLYLPETVHKQSSIANKLNRISSDVENISSTLKQRDDRINGINELVNSLDERVVDIKHKILINSQKNTSQNKITPVNNTVADDHNLDNFYKLFEDRFRGTEEDIKSRVSEYKSLFDPLPNRTKKMPIIDLGCGRGEFLSFAKDNGLNAIGIDMNHDMIVRCKNLGLEAYETDAMNYLLDQKTNSIAAITGFHIVEHIPFNLLMELFEECHRVISSEGFILFETPNPKNLVIGASNFYIDPSHTKPIPPELLSFALESVGFKTEIIFKHPAKEHIEHQDKEVEAMMNIIYGPQDYAVYAKKDSVV